ncbi:chaperonin GroEL [Streptomyces sp. WMMC500]|uniref:chaperonin GroEL n=1 Tax=Streptomyces sp. WMMC500 TaxID=3015154 RepID=UPI00248AE0DB|nr:chaperonin GroEL [Streptomyces sp. WMMC500]WBB58297.1 chaperonin GroEL [Streptomyces sp. WMMC500]
MSGLLFEDAARAALRRGVDAVADAARVTLGPRGRLVVLGGGTGPGSAGSRGAGPRPDRSGAGRSGAGRSGAGSDRSGAGAGGAAPGAGRGAGGAGTGGGAGTASGPVATRDGATVASAVTEAVRLSDPYANLGASLVRQAATRTRRAAGDGTTTTIVLTQALYAAGLRAVTAGADPVAVRRGLDAAAAAAVAYLTDTARPLDGEHDAARVAAAAGRDPALGELVAGAFAKAGRNAAISVEEAHVAGVELEFTDGLRLDRGFLSPFMMTHPEQGTAVLEDPYVLLHHGRIAGPDDLLPVMERVAATGRPLLVVADSVQQDALAALVANRLRGTLLSAAVPAPALGARRLAHLEDLAALTGAEVVVPEKGMPTGATELSSLGRAERVVVTRRTTTVTRGAGSPEAVARQVAHLEYALAGAVSDFDREVLELRLARLTGGVAVLRVGGATDPERAERRERVAGAVAAVRAALAEGVVPGGGTGLAGAREAVDGLLSGGTGQGDGTGPGDGTPARALSPDERAGALAVRAALTAPLRQLADNAGADGARVVAETAGLPPGHGWNADTGTYGDLPAAGVLDPVRVPRTALENAASVAGLMLTAGALVVDRKPRDPDAVSWRRRGHGHHHGSGHSHGHSHHH